MACYEVREVSVEFDVKSREHLANALKALDIPFWTDQQGRMHTSNNIVFDLEGKKVTYQEGDQYQEAMIKKIKQAYSFSVIEEVAKKKKWILKKGINNKLELRRY